MSAMVGALEGFFSVDGHGLRVQIPHSWEARIWASRDEASNPARDLAVIHAGSFALPHEDMHFGGLAPGKMRAGDFFIALVEYGKPSSDRWFKARGIPLPVTWLNFRESFVRNAIPQHVGLQHFFSLGERTFCLYVEGVGPPNAEGLAFLNATLGTIETT